MAEPAEIAAQRQALGERLASYRLTAQLTQGELATATFRDRTTIVHIEKGRARADDRFWRTADATLHANGVLVAVFHELEAAKRADDHQRHAAEVTEARHRAKAWRQQAELAGSSSELGIPSLATDVESDQQPSLSCVVAVLGPSQTVGVVQDFTSSLIARYELEGPHRLATEAQGLRRLCQQLGSQVSGVAERFQLARLSGQQAGLLAYMSVNLGRFAEAERYALEAAMFATAVKDSSLLAWVKGTQSFAAYYQRRYQEALSLAQVGVRLAPLDPQRVRLLSNGVARAAGKLGDRYTVDHAIHEAFELAEGQDSPAGMTPCIDFAPYGWARTAANAATAYLSVGDHAKVLRLTRQLGTVVAASESDWSRSLVSLDEATAFTLGRQSDLDHAATVGRQALAASAHKPIASVHKRATELAVSLRRVDPGHIGRDFTAALREWSKAAQTVTR